jgi:hypothetical protein
MADWLRAYYGSEWPSFSPSVVREGKRFAVVRITDTSQKGATFSKVGYILLRKTGKHGQTKERPLHEGVPTRPDLDKMFTILANSETSGSLT